jgi:hypothetical protein
MVPRPGQVTWWGGAEPERIEPMRIVKIYILVAIAR